MEKNIEEKNDNSVTYKLLDRNNNITQSDAVETESVTKSKREITAKTISKDAGECSRRESAL